MGSEVPTLIEKLSQQQIKLAKIIEGAGQNLIALENQLATASGSLENALANRTQQLQAVLDDYTVALDATLASRAEALDIAAGGAHARARCGVRRAPGAVRRFHAALDASPSTTP